jgi:type IV secretion/conjugal transfer VirB4 family ATPase
MFLKLRALQLGRDMKLGDKYLKIITILTTFPPFSKPGLFDRFNNLDVEYRWVSRFICLSKSDAQKVIEDCRQRYNQQAKSLFTYAREAITKESDPNAVDEMALANRDDAGSALMELNQDAVAYGYYTMTITVMDDDPVRCRDKANLFVEELQTMGFAGYVETFNSMEAWWGSLPGHFRANIRRPLVSSLLFCNFSPATAVWPGDLKNDHLNGPVLLYTDTSGFTPFRLSLHVGDVGHTMIVGPSGSGKSVLLNTLEAHFLKYKNSKVFIFDKAASSRALTLAVGGSFYNLAAEGNGELSFQPLARIEDEQEIKWAKEWILAYLRGKGLNVGPSEENLVWQALLSLKVFKPEMRTLTTFCDMVQDQAVRQALLPLTNKGSYGKMFDNAKDFSGTGRWQVYEMETLMGTPAVVPPTLDYLFHRIEASLKEASGPSIIVLDECWLFLDNPAFRDKLKEYFKDMRKKNTSIIIATQNLADIAAKKDLLTTVMDQCLSKIYLPNVNADGSQSAELYNMFGCNDRQVELISQMTPKQDYYYASQKGNRVFRLALRPIEIPFVTATAKTDQQAMNKILAEHDKKDFVKEWLHYKDADDEWEKYYSNYIHIKEGE